MHEGQRSHKLDLVACSEARFVGEALARLRKQLLVVPRCAAVVGPRGLSPVWGGIGWGGVGCVAVVGSCGSSPGWGGKGWVG